LKRGAAIAISPKSPQEQGKRTGLEKGRACAAFFVRAVRRERLQKIILTPLIKHRAVGFFRERRSYARNEPSLLYDSRTEVL